MNPDELLAQIADLLQQYLALGGDTPVAPEAQQLMDAIQQTGMTGGPPDADAAGAPPPEDAMAALAGGGAVPDLQGMTPSAPPTSNGGQHPFADVSAMAIEDIKRRQKQGR